LTLGGKQNARSFKKFTGRPHCGNLKKRGNVFCITKGQKTRGQKQSSELKESVKRRDVGKKSLKRGS